MPASKELAHLKDIRTLICKDIVPFWGLYCTPLFCAVLPSISSSHIVDKDVKIKVGKNT